MDKLTYAAPDPRDFATPALGPEDAATLAMEHRPGYLAGVAAAGQIRAALDARDADAGRARLAEIEAAEDEAQAQIEADRRDRLGRRCGDVRPVDLEAKAARYMAQAEAADREAAEQTLKALEALRRSIELGERAAAFRRFALADLDAADLIP